MKTLEFILILILIIVICAMAVFTRWHITVDNEWEDESSKSKTVVEADLVPNQEIYSELPVTRMEFIILLGRKLGLEQEYGPVKFKDIYPDSTNSRYIYPLLKAGLISGYSDNTFRPNDFISKNEAEIIFAKALKRSIPPSYPQSPYLTKKQMFNLLSDVAEEQNKTGKW